MRVLLTAHEIAARVDSLAAEVQCEFDAQAPVVALVVLRGAATFAADLLRAVRLDMRPEYIHAESYRGTRGGEVVVTALPELAGKQVLIVEDIIERGETLRAVVEAARSAGASRLVAVALLRKPGQVSCEVGCPTLAGFEIGPQFVVGYGMDLDGRYRNLPEIYVIAG